MVLGGVECSEVVDDPLEDPGLADPFVPSSGSAEEGSSSKNVFFRSTNLDGSGLGMLRDVGYDDVT